MPVLPTKTERATAKCKAIATAEQRELDMLAVIEEERERRDQQFQEKCDNQFDSALCLIRSAIGGGSDECFVSYRKAFRYAFKDKDNAESHSFDELRRVVARRISDIEGYQAVLHVKSITCNNWCETYSHGTKYKEWEESLYGILVTWK